MTYFKTLQLLTFCFIVSIFSCKNRSAEKNEQENIVRRSGDTVIVPSGSAIMKKLEIDTVESKEFSLQYTTTGVIRPLPGHLADVTTPFEGRVVASYVRLGEKVKQGAPVFSLSSADYFEAVKNFRESAKEKEIAERNFARKKELFDQGISSKKEFDDAAMNTEIAEKEYEKCSATLQVFNVKPEEADFTHPLIVRAPISGEIVRNDITIGQYLKSDSEPGIIVANLDNIWVVAHVKEKDLGKMSPKDKVEVFAESLPDKPVAGTVDYIGDIMEDQTRSVEVYIDCINLERLLKPGMFVTVRFYHNIASAILIPASSVLQDEGSSFLFIQAEPGKYLKRNVMVTTAENRNLLVRSGLEKGDVIVTGGGIYLR
jgi:cobalt-zinc-cadmium efflux system membrane fusion protein